MKSTEKTVDFFLTIDKYSRIIYIINAKVKEKAVMFGKFFYYFYFFTLGCLND